MAFAYTLLDSAPVVTGMVADTNSPFTLLDANAPGAHPLAIPENAIGMIVGVASIGANDGCEATIGNTKFKGIPIYRDGGVKTFRFKEAGGGTDLWRINHIGGGAGSVTASVVYLLHQ